MRKIVFFILFQAISATAFSQSLSLRDFGYPFQRTNLVVRWNVPTNALPSKVWVYHLLPRKLSAKILSNLMAACSFTDKEKTDLGDLLVFNSSDGTRHLRVSWPFGIIDYQTTGRYAPTNLTKNVPNERQALKLTKKFLPKLGISLADIEKKANGDPNFRMWQPFTEFYGPHGTITNIEFRAVDFRRSVDHMTFMGAGAGGDGEIEFGENGKISKILLTWRNTERYKCYSTASPETIIKWMREGKAVQGSIPDNSSDIDWRTVKSVTVKKVWPSFYGGNRIAPSDWLIPYIALWTTVDTGRGSIEVEIDCPIIDETKL